MNNAKDNIVSPIAAPKKVIPKERVINGKLDIMCPTCLKVFGNWISEENNKAVTGQKIYRQLNMKVCFHELKK